MTPAIMLENKRSDVQRYLENFDRSELLEIEDKYTKRNKAEIIEWIMGLDDMGIAKLHSGEALDCPPFDEDEK
jgi:hypothetical protein